MNRKYADLVVVSVMAIVGIAAALIPDLDDFRILTLPLVLVLPGYALIAVIFPNRTLGTLERLIFSLGLSFSIAIINGLILNLTPWGLQTSSWAVSLGGITLAAVLAGVLRRGQEPVVFGTSYKPSVGQVLLLGAALATAIIAIVVAYTGAIRHPSQRFTQFWITRAATDTIQLGVRSFEATTTSYRVELRIGERVIGEWTSVELQPDEEWTVQVNLPKAEADVEIVEALLYREDIPGTVYRRVFLWRR